MLTALRGILFQQDTQSVKYQQVSGIESVESVFDEATFFASFSVIQIDQGQSRKGEKTEIGTAGRANHEAFQKVQ